MNQAEAAATATTATDPSGVRDMGDLQCVRGGARVGWLGASLRTTTRGSRQSRRDTTRSVKGQPRQIRPSAKLICVGRATTASYSALLRQPGGRGDVGADVLEPLPRGDPLPDAVELAREVGHRAARTGHDDGDLPAHPVRRPRRPARPASRAGPPRRSWSALGRPRPAGRRRRPPPSPASVRGQPVRRLEEDHRAPLGGQRRRAPTPAPPPGAGRKPSKQNRSTGSPDTASAMSTADGPGTPVTRTSASTAALTRRYPGSETDGIPASVTTTHPVAARRGRSTSSGVRCASLCSW